MPKITFFFPRENFELKKIKFKGNFDPFIEIPESEYKKKFKGKERK